MSNSVIRHYGTDRMSVPHHVTSNQCRLTIDPARVTCRECIDAPSPVVVPGDVIAVRFDSIEGADPVPVAGLLPAARNGEWAMP